MTTTNQRKSSNVGIGQRAIKGAIWSGVNTLLLKFASIAVMALVVRIVTPHQFGVFAVAMVVFAIVSSFGELGLSSCIARRDLDPDKIASTVSLLAIVSSLVLAIGMAVAAGPLATALGSAEAAGPIRILSIAVFLGGLFTVPGALLVREFRQRRLFMATAISFLPMNAVLVLLALNGDGATAFAWSRVVGQLISGLVMVASIERHYWPKMVLTEVVPVLKFGLPLAGANLVSYTLLNADYAIIGRFLGPSDLGIYMLAFTVASWSTSVLSSTINSVAMPAFSAMKKDSDGLRQMLGRAATVVALIAFPISAVTFVLAKDLIEVIYGSTWIEAAPILSVLVIYGGIFSFSLLLSNLLVGTGRAGVLFFVQLIWIAALLPLVAIGITHFGLLGAAYAHVVVIVVVVIPIYLWALHSSGFQVSKVLATSIARPLIAAVVAAGAAWGVASFFDASIWRILIGGLTAALVYLLGVLPVVRGLAPESVGGSLAKMVRIYDSTIGFAASRTARIRRD